MGKEVSVARLLPHPSATIIIFIDDFLSILAD
jgi:hypothetical protein